MIKSDKLPSSHQWSSTMYLQLGLFTTLLVQYLFSIQLSCLTIKICVFLLPSTIPWSFFSSQVICIFMKPNNFPNLGLLNNYFFVSCLFPVVTNGCESRAIWQSLKKKKICVFEFKCYRKIQRILNIIDQEGDKILTFY